MTMRTSSHLRTICEVLREINDLHQGVSEHDIVIRRKLREAEKMGKRMDKKLLEYAKHYQPEFFKENPNYEKNLKKRLKKSYLYAK